MAKLVDDHPFLQLTTHQFEDTRSNLITILCSFLFLSQICALTFLVFFRSDMFKRRKVITMLCMQVARFTYGILFSIIGFYYVVIDDTLKNDLVHAKTPLSVLALHAMIGVFIFELVYNYSFNGMDGPLWFHHIISLFGIALTAYYEKGHFAVVGGGLLAEMVVPFSAFKWILLKINNNERRVVFYQKMNQVFLIFFYHCRSLNEMYYCYLMYSQWKRVWSDMPSPILYVNLTVTPVLMFYLTPYWTYRCYMRLMSYL